MMDDRVVVCGCLGLAVVMLITQAVAGASAGDEPLGERADVHSHARPVAVRVKHVGLDLTVEFEAKILRGTATLTVERAPGSPPDAPLVLDSRGLQIEKAEPVVGRRPIEPVLCEVGPVDRVLGAALTLHLPPEATGVRITYRTSPEASALQWVDPKGTAGGKHPFLFTQSQAIHARSWIPLQDSPAVRVTYDATIRVPAGLTALMSADAKGVTRTEEGSRWTFAMPQPVAPYLIALAVGDLAFRPISDRTGVWAEPAVVEKAAAEFADTETMVKTAERRYGPYRWGRYDLLILPPSFPFGGMENPKLTFATPTVIAGDRSLVSLVAHELAHSWSGNLATNATWRDFWLNEGFTTYIERRIIEDLYGPRRAAMERTLGFRELQDELKELPPRDQVLHIDLAGRDPDDGMTRIPYEKGALFLTTLEHAFGRARFDAFLHAYFEHFAFRSVTTADLVAYLRLNLLRPDEPATKSINLHDWLEEPGLPAGYPEPDTSVFARVDAAARDWTAGTMHADRLDTHDWTTHEWLRFLQTLPERIPAGRMTELDKACHLTDRGNTEVACQWLVMAVRNGYAPADARLESFLTTIGRRKFLMPLYTELAKTPAGAVRARAIFARARPFYHPISAESVEKLLAKKPK